MYEATMSFTELHMLEQNCTAELIDLRRHIVKLRFFPDIYSHDFSWGRKISFREEETCTFMEPARVQVYRFIIFALPFIRCLSTLPISISFPFILCLL